MPPSSADQTALLQGLDLGLPSTAGGGRGGRGGGGGRGAAAPARPVALAEPAAQHAGGTELRYRRARQACSREARLAEQAHAAVVVTPLTAEEQKQFAAGSRVYKNICLGCHQPDGRGKEKDRALAGGVAVRPGLTAGPQPNPAGRQGRPDRPDAAARRRAERRADCLGADHVRREWGSTGAPVSVEDVREVRSASRTRAAVDRRRAPACRAGREAGADSSFVGQPFIPSSLLGRSSCNQKFWTASVVAGRDSRDRWRCPAGRAAGPGAAPAGRGGRGGGRGVALDSSLHSTPTRTAR